MNGVHTHGIEDSSPSRRWRLMFAPSMLNAEPPAGVRTSSATQLEISFETTRQVFGVGDHDCWRGMGRKRAIFSS